MWCAHFSERAESRTQNAEFKRQNAASGRAGRPQRNQYAGAMDNDDFMANTSTDEVLSAPWEVWLALIVIASISFWFQAVVTEERYSVSCALFNAICAEKYCQLCFRSCSCSCSYSCFVLYRLDAHHTHSSNILFSPTLSRSVDSFQL